MHVSVAAGRADRKETDVVARLNFYSDVMVARLIGMSNFLLAVNRCLQRGTKRYVNLAKQDPGKARQSS